MTWDFCYGKEFTQDTEKEIIEALEKDFISGLTLLGGEPFEPENQKVLAPFLKKVKELFPKKNIWCYSGYIYETELLAENGKAHTEVTEEMLSYIDVLVDGPFVEELKDISLVFRGSSNQRILKLAELRKE